MSVISQIKSILESAVNNKYTVELRIEDKNTVPNRKINKDLGRCLHG